VSKEGVLLSELREDMKLKDCWALGIKDIKNINKALTIKWKLRLTMKKKKYEKR